MRCRYVWRLRLDGSCRACRVFGPHLPPLPQKFQASLIKPRPVHLTGRSPSLSLCPSLLVSPGSEAHITEPVLSFTDKLQISFFRIGRIYPSTKIRWRNRHLSQPQVATLKISSLLGKNRIFISAARSSVWHTPSLLKAFAWLGRSRLTSDMEHIPPVLGVSRSLAFLFLLQSEAKTRSKGR